MSLFKSLTLLIQKMKTTHGTLPDSTPQNSVDGWRNGLATEPQLCGCSDPRSRGPELTLEAWLRNDAETFAISDLPDVRYLLFASELKSVNEAIVRETMSRLEDSPNFEGDTRPLALLMTRAATFEDVLRDGGPVDEVTLNRLHFGRNQSVGRTLANNISSRNGPQAIRDLDRLFFALSKRYRCLMLMEFCRRTFGNGLAVPRNCEVVVEPETCCRQAFELFGTTCPIDQFPILPLEKCRARDCRCTIRVLPD